MIIFPWAGRLDLRIVTNRNTACATPCTLYCAKETTVKCRVEKFIFDFEFTTLACQIFCHIIQSMIHSFGGLRFQMTALSISRQTLDGDVQVCMLLKVCPLGQPPIFCASPRSSIVNTKARESYLRGADRYLVDKWPPPRLVSCISQKLLLVSRAPNISGWDSLASTTFSTVGRVLKQEELEYLVLWSNMISVYVHLFSRLAVRTFLLMYSYMNAGKILKSDYWVGCAVNNVYHKQLLGISQFLTF